MKDFPTTLSMIEERVRNIDPKRYANTRNFQDGAVTRLSPYISRGVISTKQVYQHICILDLPWFEKEKLVQELAWRDYWQQVWIAKGDGIKTDLKQAQIPISNHQIPAAIVNANTGIEVVDEAIKELYQTVYMHNHMRMYVASLCCNIAQCHWLEPAKWLYGHLLDGDVASNHLSWQWVAGAFSNKKYYANQSNINTFFNSIQQNTFLDVDYSEFEHMQIPEALRETVPFVTKTVLPKVEKPELDPSKTILIYTYYNLDPYWHQEEDSQRVLLLEPSFFETYPVSQHCLEFALNLARNISGLHVFVGEFAELQTQLNGTQIIYKEHPSNRHFKGIEEPRDWMSGVAGYFPYFFAFWKKVKKELNEST